MKITIRKAKISDLPVLDKLGNTLINYHIQELYTSDDRYYNQKKKDSNSIWKKFIGHHIKNKKSLVLLAYDREKPIGYCLAFIKQNISFYKISEYAYTSDIYVNKKHRNQGIGKRFMNLVKKFYKKQKIKFLELQLNHNNDYALKFYQKIGFKEYHKTMRMRI